MRTKLATCERKVRFSGEAVAARFALTRQLKQRPYRCNRCGQWHLSKRGMKEEE